MSFEAEKLVQTVLCLEAEYHPGLCMRTMKEVF
jgi:hypothetical protein